MTNLSERKKSTLWRKFIFPVELLYIWLWGLVLKGFRKALTLADLPTLDTDCESTYYLERFSKIWKKTQKLKKPRLVISLILTFWYDFLVSGVFQLLAVIFTVSYPIFLSFILKNTGSFFSIDVKEEISRLQSILPDNLQPSSDASSLGYRTNNYIIWVWLFLVIIIQFTGIVFQEYSTYRSSVLGMKTKALLTSEIFQKRLKLSAEGQSKYTLGAILNFVTMDLTNIEVSIEKLHFVWGGGLILVLVFGLITQYLGISVLFSVGLAIFFLPVVVIVNMLILKNMRKYMMIGDKRISSMTEIFSGISILKYFNWEKVYLNKIIDVRKIQIKQLRIVSMLKSVVVSLLGTLPPLLMFIGFLGFFLVNGKVNSIKFLSSFTYYSILRMPLMFMPQALTQIIISLLSFNRIQQYLVEEESKESEKKVKNEENVVEVENATLEYPKEKGVFANIDEENKNFALKNINFEIKKGSFVIIVGTVGSGKTSIFNAIMGDMILKEGSLNVSSSISYCPQSSYILQGSIEENILFFNKKDNEKYNEVVKVCELQNDLDTLGGNQFEISENGSNLSGGQKARLCLSRAVYNESEMYLLDDIVSAVDPEVAKNIFDNCIRGRLKNKTVVLITHQLNYCRYADQIIVMENGSIKEKGTFEQLTKEENGTFSKLLSGEKKTKLQKSSVRNKNKEQAKIIEKEDSGTGGLKFEIISEYIKSLGGWILFTIIFIVFGVTMGFFLLNDWWISNFSSNNGLFIEQYSNEFETNYAMYNGTSGLEYEYIGNEVNFTCPVSKCIEQRENVSIFWMDYINEDIKTKSGMNIVVAIIIYAVIAISLPISFFLRACCLFNMGVNAANEIFQNALKGVIKAKESFFHSNPLGRIMNRFSVDTKIIDVDLPQHNYMALGTFFGVTGVLVLVSILTYGLFVPIAVIALFLYSVLFLFYRRTSRELKRIELKQMSPILNSFNELKGKSTIKVMGKEKDFILRNQFRINEQNRAHYLLLASSRWVVIYLNVLGMVVVVGTSIISILISYYLNDYLKLNQSFLNLCISRSSSFSFLFAWSVFYIINVEVSLYSVERLLKFKNIKGENLDYEKKDKIFTQGEINFNQFYLKYRKDLPYVVKGLNINIYPNERVGIVGRTGAGKSSILVGLLKLVDDNCIKGSITIDGKNTSSLSTSEVRRNISIIPQSPILFSGTIKSNLDPEGEYSDEFIIETIKKSKLDKILGLTDQFLQKEVLEGGSNFSIGQRQLICLIRAVLKNSKIILCDEVTSNVDLKTDELIQKTIRNNFKATVITIAHRIRTICDYDRICVLDKGGVVEFDSPENLYKKKGTFFDMVQESVDTKEVIEIIEKRKKCCWVKENDSTTKFFVSELLKNDYLDLEKEKIMFEKIDKIVEFKTKFQIELEDGRKLFLMGNDSKEICKKIIEELN